MLPEKAEDERCAKCNNFILRSWYGRLRLDITVPRDRAEDVEQALQSIGADLGRTLCWDCLGCALTNFFNWRDEHPSSSD